MEFSPKQRWSVIGGALLLTLAAMYLVNDDGQQEAVDHKTSYMPPKLKNALSADPFARGANSVSPSINDHVVQKQSSMVPGDVGALPEISQQRMRSAHQGKDSPHPDLLSTHAWYVPPPPQPIVESIPIEKPVAPVAPYQYMGKLEDSPQGTLIFLAVRNKVQTVVIGQIIDSAWRLDSEDANALHLTYLPLGTTQVLSKTARRALAANATANNAVTDN